MPRLTFLLGAFLKFSATDKFLINDVQRIILSWLEERLFEVDNLFDDDIDLLLVNKSAKISGKKQCMDYLEGTLHDKKIIQYDEDNFTVQFDGIITAVEYKFTVRFEEKGSVVCESGSDCFIFKKYFDAWKLRWRIIYPFN